MEQLNLKGDIIGVAGDWHGQTGWAMRVIRSFYAAGVKHVFHLGDFGFWGGQDGAVYIRKVNKILTNLGITLYVTAGNHEDYKRIYSKELDENGLYVYAENIKVFPRGYHGFIGGVDFVSLGGANSIDFKHRTVNKTWWEEERITVEDYTKTISEGKKTLMFCHDVPDGVNLDTFRKTWREGWDEEELAYSNLSRKILRETINIVQPDILFHGHYHIFQDVSTVFETVLKETFTVRTVGLAKEEMDKNAIVFDVNTLTYQIVQV